MEHGTYLLIVEMKAISLPAVGKSYLQFKNLESIFRNVERLLGNFLGLKTYRLKIADT